MNTETIERLRRRIERSSEVRPDCDCETCRDDAAILAVLEAAQSFVTDGEHLDHWEEDGVWVCAKCQVPRFANFPGFEPMPHLADCVWGALLALFEEGI